MRCHLPIHRRACVAFAGALVSVAALAASPAAAGDVVVDVTEVRNGNGVVKIALCPESLFLSERDECPYRGEAAAMSGTTQIVVEGVEPGVYGIQGWHDENANDAMDRNLVGFPLEGFAFSNDARVVLRPPSFADAAITVSEAGLTHTMRMRYR